MYGLIDSLEQREDLLEVILDQRRKYKESQIKQNKIIEARDDLNSFINGMIYGYTFNEELYKKVINYYTDLVNKIKNS
jgi:hypothetical protein